MSVEKKMILSNLHISMWAGRKFDAAATRTVNEQHQSKEAGRFTKVLLKSTELDAVKKAAGVVKKFHYDTTVPWEDRGSRALPIMEYINYTTEMDTKIKNFNKKVEEFLATYEDAITEREDELGTLFHRGEYPTQKQLLQKFSIEYQFTPIANSSDLRVDVSKSEAKEIKKNIEAALKSKMANAKNDVKLRIHKAVKRVYDKLNEKDGKFHDTMISNIEGMIEMIPALNFDDDAEINDFVPKLQKLCVKPQVVRDNLKKRRKLKKRAKKLLKELNIEE